LDVRISVEIPDDLAPGIVPGDDPSRAALESLGLEAYRLSRITGYQLRSLLGLRSRWDLHALLHEHQIDMYSVEAFEKDLEVIEQRRKRNPIKTPA
jgi:hypothetical protein